MFPKAQIYIDGELIGGGELKEFNVKQKHFEKIPDKIEQIVFEFKLKSNKEQLSALLNLCQPETFSHKIKRIFRKIFGG